MLSKNLIFTLLLIAYFPCSATCNFPEKNYGKLTSLNTDNATNPTTMHMTDLNPAPIINTLNTLTLIIVTQPPTPTTTPIEVERTDGDAFAAAFARNLRQLRNQTALTSTVGQRRQRENNEENNQRNTTRQRRDHNA